MKLLSGNQYALKMQYKVTLSSIRSILSRKYVCIKNDDQNIPMRKRIYIKLFKRYMINETN